MSWSSPSIKSCTPCRSLFIERPECPVPLPGPSRLASRPGNWRVSKGPIINPAYAVNSTTDASVTVVYRALVQLSVAVPRGRRPASSGGH